MTSRTYSGTTAALSYNTLNQLVEWNAGSTNQEWYVYDASGNRVLKRSTNSTGTTLTVYPFGLEEHQYSGTGTNQSNTYYYFLGNQLIGDMGGTGTYFLLTDALGSVLSDLSWVAGSASVQGTQVFGPYGNARAVQGTINTAKGFTGQYNDALTGLDYYNARYYDPVVGVFLSADPVQGNGSGENPYAYVDGNPETYADPTGQGPMGAQEPPPPKPVPPVIPPELWPILGPWLGVGLLWATSLLIMFAPQQQHSPLTPQPQPAPTPTPPSTGCCALSLTPHQNQISGIPVSFQPHISPPQPQTGSDGQGGVPPITHAAAAGSQPCSFTPDTPVTTDHGEQAIGKLHTGEKVLAYNPKTHKMEPEPVLHVWKHTDNDLVDLTITTTTPAQHGKPATRTSEVVHTTSEHPFFTTEQGFVAAGKVKMGMHVLRADGSVGVVTGWKIVHGTKVMYNLEVAQDHTFTVGVGQWVVHNCGSGPGASVRVLQKGLEIVKGHLSQPQFLNPDTGLMEPENAAMLSRLEAALNEGSMITGADANFYLHELSESTLMKRGIPYEVAHELALSRYGVSPFSVYHPDVIQSFPELFNENWFKFWGIGGSE